MTYFDVDPDTGTAVGPYRSGPCPFHPGIGCGLRSRPPPESAAGPAFSHAAGAKQFFPIYTRILCAARLGKAASPRDENYCTFIVHNAAADHMFPPARGCELDKRIEWIYNSHYCSE